MIESNLNIEKKAVVNAIVNDSNTAKAVGSGSLDVYATPMMIALMEQAACKCIADALSQGETSVGTEICVSHTAASPLGAQIKATAIIKNIVGRKIEFSVIANDDVGEIGNGRHTRVVVDAERFTERAQTRK